MGRKRYNNCSGTLVTSGTDVTNSTSATVINFVAALTANGTAVPTLTGSDYIALTLDPGTANEEIVYLTAYTSGATTGTVTRAQEGTTGKTHPSGAWAVTPTVTDWTAGGDGSGTLDALTVTGLRGATLDPTMASPTSGQVPEWNGSAWVPTALPPATTAYGSANFFGHSWLAGLGTTNPGGYDRSIMGKFAAILSIPAFNIRSFAHAGGFLAIPAQSPTSCDFGSVSQLLFPEGSSSLENAGNSSLLSNPYLLADVEDSGLCIWLLGLNDGIDVGSGNMTTVPMAHSLRLEIARSLAGIVVPWTDSSVTFPTGTWTSTASSTKPVNTGPSYNQASAAGSFQVTLPAEFPGGWVDVQLVCPPNNDTSGCYVTWSGTASGAATTSTWTGSPTFTASGSGNGPFKLQRSSGSWATDGVVVGHGISTNGTGAAANNKVIGITTTTNPNDTIVLLYTAGTGVTTVTTGATQTTLGGQGSYDGITRFNGGVVNRFWCQSSDAGKTIIGTFNAGTGGSPSIGVDSWSLEAPFANQAPKLVCNVPRHCHGNFWAFADPITAIPQINAIFAAVVAEFNGTQPSTSTAPPTNTNVALVDLDAVIYPRSGLLTSAATGPVSSSPAAASAAGSVLTYTGSIPTGVATGQIVTGAGITGSAIVTGTTSTTVTLAPLGASTIGTLTASAYSYYAPTTTISVTTNGTGFNPGPTYGGTMFPISVATAGQTPEWMWVTNVTKAGGGDPRTGGVIPASTALTLSVVRNVNTLNTGICDGTVNGTTGAWVGDASWLGIDTVHPNSYGAGLFTAALKNTFQTVPSANANSTVAQGAGSWTEGRSLPVNGTISGYRLYVPGTTKTTKQFVNGQFYATPVYLPARCVLIDMGIYLRSLGSGSWSMFMGIYLPDPSLGRPGSLMTSFGAATILSTKATASADNSMLLTSGAAGAGSPVSMVLEPGPYWIGIGITGAPATPPTAAAIEEVVGPMGSTMMVPDADASWLNQNGYYLTGQAAAPASFGSFNLYSGMMPRLWLKLAASQLG